MFSFLFLFVLFVAAAGHPQCLDFQPPFEPQNSLNMCSEYQSLSCCNDEREISTEYSRILQNINQTVFLQCNSFIQAILCQKCSPYAAHLYFAENSLMPTTFPSLCSNFYNNFFNTCGHLVPLFTSTTPNQPDPNYCYPEIATNAEATDNLGQTNVQGSCLQLCVREVINDLFSPTSAKPANDGTHRMFVVEQRGVVWIYLANFTKLSPPFIDIRSQVYESGRRADERGLLDIAFHPNFRQNGRFFLYYSFLNGRTHVSRISEFRVSSEDMNRADRNSERVIIDVPQIAGNHNGGPLLFKDGFLYIFTGDGGRANDPQGHGQNKNSLLGKVLRVNVDNRPAGQPYTTPADNPFVGEPNTRSEIYAYGLRNPWRCSLDRGDPDTGEGAGRIFCGDVGQNNIEEVDIIESGANYGWNGYEGNNCFRDCNRVANHARPIDTYDHTVGRSITGGYVYRGCESPNLNGKYIFGDWENGRLFYLEYVNDSWRRRNICMGGNDLCINGGLSSSYSRYINSFAEDELGEVYILATPRPQSTIRAGRMYQLVDPSRRGNPSTCARTLTTELVFHSSTTFTPYQPPSQPRTTAPPTTTTVATLPPLPAALNLFIRIRHTDPQAQGRYGLVEIRRSESEEWGSICAQGWGSSDARVLCRQLGFVRGFAIGYVSRYGVRRGPFWLDNLECTGNEVSLLSCRNANFQRRDNCSRNRPAAVFCYRRRN